MIITMIITSTSNEIFTSIITTINTIITADDMWSLVKIIYSGERTLRTDGDRTAIFWGLGRRFNHLATETWMES